MRNRPLRTHPTDHLLGPHMALETRCGGEKRRLAHAALTLPCPLPQMLRAQIRTARPGSLTTADHTLPAVNRVLVRDLDHVRAKDRIKRRTGDQGSQHLQPVPPHTIRSILK
jgi:hypothetical protein